MEIKNKTNKTMPVLMVICGFALMFFVFATSISCMGIYLKPVSETFGISRTQFSMTTTIGSVAMMVSALFAGKILGKIGVKLMMTVGIIMGAASMLLYSIAGSITVFYAAAVLMGTAVTFTCNMPVSVLINDWFEPSKTGTALGIAFVGSGAGAMVLNPLYTHIIENFGWRTSFRVAAICIAVLLIPVLLFVKRKGENTKSAGEKKNFTFTMSDVVKKPAMWGVFIAFILISLSNMAVLNHGVAYMTDNGISPEKAASVISIGSAALILGKIILGRLIDKIGVYKATVFGSIMMLVSVLGMWLSGVVGTGMIVAYVIGYGLGAGVATVSMPGVINYMFEGCDFSSIMGLFCTTGGLGGMLQIFISVIYDRTGSYHMAWIAVTAISVLLILLFAFMMKPQKKNSDRNISCCRVVNE